MIRILAIFFALWSASADAQSIQQSGSVTPGHAWKVITNGVAGDAGTAANGALTSLGVTASGPGLCQNSGPITGPYNALCFAPTSTGGGFTWNNYGGATGAPTISYNGTIYPLTPLNSFAGTEPITVTFPSGVVTYAFDYAHSGTFIATQTFNAVTINGAVTAAGLATPSSNIAGSICMTSGGSMLYYASNNCYTVSATSITAGTTTVTGGPGVLSNASSGGVLVSSTTLPSGLSIPAPTVTGTANFTGTLEVGGNAIGYYAQAATAQNLYLGQVPSGTPANDFTLVVGTGNGTPTTGDNNIFVGTDNGSSVGAGATNILFGYNNGGSITTGSNNTFLGHTITGPVGTSGNTVVGASITLSSTAANEVVLADGVGNARFDYGYTTASVNTITGATTITGALTTNITGGGTQCVQVSNTGVLSGTGAACGSGSGAVNSVANSDGTLTISPTTGTVVASLALGHANTWSGAQTFSANLTVSAASLILSGNISAAAWTTAGVRYANPAATYTDTSSSGTVALAYTDLFGAVTVAASSATVYTEYVGTYFKAPVAGSSVTMTAKYALGADSAIFGSSTGATFSTAGQLVINNTTQATTGITGSINTLGGLGVSKNIALPPGASGVGTIVWSSSAGSLWTDANANQFWGSGTGNYTLTGQFNLGFGSGTLTALTSGGSNLGFGEDALSAATSTSSNIGLGFQALTTLTTGSGSNLGIGFRALQHLLTGTFNVAIGGQAGQNYTGAENYNVLIGTALGTVGESGTIQLADGNANLRLDYGHTTASTWTMAGALALPGIASSTAAQTGTLCYGTGGNVTYDPTLGCLTSLEELKDIQGPIEDGLHDVMALNPFWFRPINRPIGSDLAEQPGLGAHQVEAVDKRLVGYDDNGNLRGVRYVEMTAVLVAAIQQQQAEIADLKQRIH